MNHVDENNALYQRIRTGDNSAVAEMIERNMPLVRSRVSNFLKDYRRFRHLRDDLEGEGFLALTEAVNSLQTTDVEKPTGYIVSAIDYALSNYVDTEIGAGMMTGRTVQRHRASGDSIPFQLPFDPAEPPVHLWRKGRKQVDDDNSPSDLPELEPSEIEKVSKVSSDDAAQIVAQYEQADSTPESDLLDRILDCCTDEEKAIVNLRLDGLTDAEICEQLGISRATVGRRRKAIEQRMKKPGRRG